MFALITAGACGEPSPELFETLKMLSNSNKRALDLVLNLIESFRLRKDVQLMQYASLDLPLLIESTIAELEVSALPRKVHIGTTISPDFPPCVLDKLAISRLLVNLLDNAIKFTPEDGKISVSAELDHGKIVIKVKDTGMGIPTQDKDVIFRKGMRGSKNRGRYTPGCGLGLYICKAIVKAHHGQISFDSTVGVGTTFKVVLPRTV